MENTPESEYVKLRPEQIVDRLCGGAQAGSQKHEEIKGALFAVLARNLIGAIDKHEAAATKLSNRILWLNILLGIFTVVGALIAILQAFGKL